MDNNGMNGTISTVNNGINITVHGGNVTINNYPTPYRTVVGERGVVHTFYSKQDYQDYVEEHLEQR